MSGVKKTGEIHIPLEIKKELDALPNSTHITVFTKEQDDIIAYCRMKKCNQKSFRGISDYIFAKYKKKISENTVRKRWHDIKNNYNS